MADFYFYTDLDLIANTQSTDAFGPVDQNNFRITNIQKVETGITIDPNAYAVCDGYVLVQPDANDNTLVNLIIKPINQGDVSFLKVKYFVYRGILRSSLINGNQVVDESTHPFAKKIWDTERKLMKDNNAIPSSSVLGIQYRATAPQNDPELKLNADPIDSVFYNPVTSFRLPEVKTGWQIGQFEKDHIKFEIMVDRLGHIPTFGDLRMSDNIIQATTLPSNPTVAQRLQNASDREKILNYIDPCAYYGLHIKSKIFYYNNGEDSSKNGHKLKKEEDIYDEILTKFQNSGKVYLDIRNENSLSYNYAGNYIENLNFSADPEGDFVSESYKSSSWPIKIINPSDFASGNSNLRKNIVRIQLPQGVNEAAVLYLSHALQYDEYPSKRRKFKRELFTDLQDKKKFLNITYTSSLTQEIQFGVPNIKGKGGTTPSCWYLQIDYIKRISATPSPVILPTIHYLDNLFPLSGAPSSGGDPTEWVNSNPTKFTTGFHRKFLDANEPLGFAAMMETGIATDNNGVLFFAYPIHTYFNKFSEKIKYDEISSSTRQDLFLDYIDKQFKKLSLSKCSIDLSVDQSFIAFEPSEDSSSDYFRKLGFFAIGMSRTEYNQLITNSQINLNPPTGLINYLYHFCSLNNINVQAVNDDGGNGYYQADFDFCGKNQSGATVYGTSHITTYSGDGIIFVSNAYANNIIAGCRETTIQFNEKDRGAVVARLTEFGNNKFWTLSEFDPEAKQYNDVLYPDSSNDYFNANRAQSPVRIYVGTRVIKFEKKRVAINGKLELRRRIVCWYNRAYREGYIDENAFLGLVSTPGILRTRVQNQNDATRNTESILDQGTVIIDTECYEVNSFLQDAYHDIHICNLILSQYSQTGQHLKFRNLLDKISNTTNGLLKTFVDKCNNGTQEQKRNILKRFVQLRRKQDDVLKHIPNDNPINLINYETENNGAFVTFDQTKIKVVSTYSKFLDFDFFKAGNDFSMLENQSFFDNELLIIRLNEKWIEKEGDFYSKNRTAFTTGNPVIAFSLPEFFDLLKATVTIGTTTTELFYFGGKFIKERLQKEIGTIDNVLVTDAVNEVNNPVNKLKQNFRYLRHYINQRKLKNLPGDPIVASEETDWLLSLLDNAVENSYKTYIIIGTNVWDHENVHGSNIYDYWVKQPKGSDNPAVKQKILPLDCSYGYANSNNTFTSLVYLLSKPVIFNTNPVSSEINFPAPADGLITNEQEETSVAGLAWNKVKQTNFADFNTNGVILPLDSGYQRSLEIRDFFQRNSEIGLFYLKIYLDYLNQ